MKSRHLRDYTIPASRNLSQFTEEDEWENPSSLIYYVIETFVIVVLYVLEYAAEFLPFGG